MAKKIKPTTYEIVTDRIIALLEAGTVPWRKTWATDGGGMPMNLNSGKEYRGINVMMLAFSGFASPYWLTYKQAKQRGGQVRKGEHGSPVVFWKFIEKKDAKPGESKTVPLLRRYTVFNLDQIDGIDAPDAPTPNEWNPIENCEAVAAGYVDGPAVAHGEARAYYRPALDAINMPARDRFESGAAYYATLFHEMTHSTGHESRLARSGVTDPIQFGSHDYSKEELIAEMGAAFLCGHCGIDGDTIDNAASYIASWLKRLRDDPKLVVSAAGAAQRAADRILGVTFDNDEGGK